MGTPAGAFPASQKQRSITASETGYAGFLTGVAKFEHDRPYLLSEHGIYVRERITDLLRSEWSPTLTSEFARTPAGISLLRKAWIDFFVFLGKFCYDSSDHITSPVRKERGVPG